MGGNYVVNLDEDSGSEKKDQYKRFWRENWQAFVMWISNGEDRKKLKTTEVFWTWVFGDAISKKITVGESE